MSLGSELRRESFHSSVGFRWRVRPPAVWRWTLGYGRGLGAGNLYKPQSSNPALDERGRGTAEGPSMSVGRSEVERRVCAAFMTLCLSSYTGCSDLDHEAWRVVCEGAKARRRFEA